MPRLQINLLPDIKLQATQQQKSKNLVITGAVLISAACLAIALLLVATVYVVQKKQLSDSNKDITRSTAQLKATPNLDRVLTIQNQLKSLSNLHHQKHATSRIFDYLTKITPTQITLNSVSLDTTTNTIKISGTADSQHSVNVFADTLKFTNFKMGSTADAKPAFSGVTEDSFAVAGNSTTFSMSFKYDPLLFSNGQLDSNGKVITPVLVVPQKTTTRSTLNDSTNGLFTQ